MPPTPPVGGLQDHLVVHYPKTADVDDLSLWTFGDIAPELVSRAGLPERPGVERRGRVRRLPLHRAGHQRREERRSRRDRRRLHGQEVRHRADRTIDPSVTPEVWLRPTDGATYTSQAAAQGFATVHYPVRTGPTTAGACTSSATRCPRRSDAVDRAAAAHRHRRVRPLLAGAGRRPRPSPSSFIVHKGDEKDPVPTRASSPPSRPRPGSSRRRDRATRRERPRWTSPSCTTPAPPATTATTARRTSPTTGGCTPGPAPTPPLAWADAEKPVRQDRFGQVFEVDLVDGATSLSYILHRGDAKDLPADQSLDLVTVGPRGLDHLRRGGVPAPGAGRVRAPSPVTSRRARPTGSPRTSSPGTSTTPTATYSLPTSPDGGLELVPGGVGGGECVELRVGVRLAAGRAGGGSPPGGLRRPAGAGRHRRRRGAQGRARGLLRQGRGAHGRDRRADPGGARRPLRRRGPRRRPRRRPGTATSRRCGCGRRPPGR